MVWKKPENQLFPVQISTMVPCKVLLGCLESTFKILSYAQKMSENSFFQLNSLLCLPGKSEVVEIRQNSACHLSQNLE